MEECSENKKCEYKQKTATVKEIRDDDHSVETIRISDALLEILVKDPVFGRSDYSELPGVKTNVRSSWRSFAEYPRRSAALTTPVWQRRNNSVSLEERQRKNDATRIRREKLNIQRVEKRERQRFQQRERKRQRALFDKLQNQSSESGENAFSGLIISSPKKVSPLKLWKDSKKSDTGKSQKKGDSDSKSHKYNGGSQKTVVGARNKGIGDLTNSNVDQIIREVTDEVSTTSIYQYSESVHGTENNFPSSLSLTPSNSSTGKQLSDSFSEEHDDNPVSSSSQVEADMSLSNPLLKSSTTNNSKSPVSALCAVTSTTEIVAADSSTPNTTERKKRNIKRVNYTEMLEEDFDQDISQPDVRESKTSGRTIRPVKRSLEKAIVDASLKKSPRKRKKSVDSSENISSQALSDFSFNAEDESGELKQQSKKQKKSAVPRAAPEQEKSKNVKHLSKGCEPGQFMSTAPTEAPGHSQLSDLGGMSQQHQMLTSMPSSQAPSLHPLSVGDPAIGHMYPQDLHLCNMPSVTSSYQSDLFPCNQQLYSNPHITPNNPSPGLLVSDMQKPHFSHMYSATSSPLQRQYPVLNLHVASRYPLNFPSTQLISQPHIPPTSSSKLICNMNKPQTSLPNFLLGPYANAPSTAPSSSDVGSHHITSQSSLSKKEHLLSNGVGSFASSAAKNGSAQEFMVTTHSGTHNLPQHSLSISLQNIVQTSSSLPVDSSLVQGSSFATAGNDIINKNNPEVSFSQWQSQLEIERMLNSIYTNHTITNNSNSNNEIQSKKMQSSDIKSGQDQKGIESMSTVEPAHKINTKPSLPLQESSGLIKKHLESTSQSPLQGSSFPNSSPNAYKRPQNILQPPPPLLPVSDFCHFPLSPRTFNSGLASIAHQNVRSPSTHQNISPTVSVANKLQQASLSASQITSITEKSSTQTQGTKQKLVVVEQQGNLIHQNMINSRPQSAHTQSRSLGLSSHTSQVNHTPDSSLSKQAQLPNMHAILNPLNSVSVKNEKTGYHRTRMPASELVRCSIVSKQLPQYTNSARHAPPRLVAQQKSTLQQCKSQFERHLLNAFGAYRMTSAYRPSCASIAKNAQHTNTQCQRPAVGPTQSLTSLHRTSSDSSKLFPATPEVSQYSSAKSVMEILNSNQLPTKTTGALRFVQSQSNQQQVLTKTGLFMPAYCPRNTMNSQTPISSSLMQNSSSTNEGPYRAYLQNDMHNTLPSSRLLQGQVPPLLHKSTEVVKQSNNSSVSGHSSQAYLPIVTISGSLPVADIKPVGSSLLHALDLNHRSSNDRQNQLSVIATTASSVHVSSTTTSSVLTSQQAPITSNKPKVSYDYPLTRVQIKQEFLSHSEQSENYNSVPLHPDCQRSQASKGAVLSSTKFHDQPSSARQPETLQTLNYVTNTSAPTTTSASVTSQPSLRDKSSNTYVTDNISIKKEANVSNGANTRPLCLPSKTVTTMSCLTSLAVSQATRASQISQSISVTASTSEPLMSSLSTNLNSMQSPQPVSTPSAIRSMLSGNRTCSSLEKRSVVKTLPPAHVIIKQETHTDLVTEKTTNTSHPSDLNNAPTSAKHVFHPSVADYQSALILGENASFLQAIYSNAELDIASRAMSPSQQNIQCSTNIENASPEDNMNIGKLAESTVTRSTSSNCQSFNSQAAPANTLPHLSGSVHATSATVAELSKRTAQPNNMRTAVEQILDNTFHNSSVKSAVSSAEYHSLKVAQDMESVITSSLTPVLKISTASHIDASVNQEPIYSQDNSATSRTEIAIDVLPVISTGPLNSQANLINVSKPCTLSNDPLFAWYTDSPKVINSSLIDDITNSFSENNSNFYTVTVNESSSLLPCDFSTSLADIGTVKVELSIDPTALNRNLLIDLTDNDEDIESSSCGLNSGQDCINSYSQPVHSFKPQKVAGNSTLASTATNNEDRYLSVNTQMPNISPFSASQSIDLFEGIKSPSVGTSSICSYGHSQALVGEIVNNSLAGQNDAITGEQMSYVHDCVARLGTDLSTVTSIIGGDVSASDNSIASSLNFHDTSPRKEPERSSLQPMRDSDRSFTSLRKEPCRFSIDPPIQVSEQTLVTQDKTLTKASSPYQPTVQSARSSIKQEQTNTANTFVINLGNIPSSKEDTQSVVVKKEHVEHICIDDEDEDDTSSNVTSHLTSHSTLDVNLSRIVQGPGGSLIPQQVQQSLESKSSMMSPASSAGHGLASVANWSKDEVSAWLKKHKLDKICPNLIGLDGRGLQRMALEHHHNYDNFYSRLRKTLGLSCFQTLMISRSMKELNDDETTDNS